MNLNAARILDEYLVAAARTGESKAFAMLAERWHPKLIAHCWRLTGDREAAKECVQECWVEIARGLARLRDERAFRAWAYRIATRRCAKAVNRKVRDRGLGEALAHESPDLEPAPGASLDAQRLRRAIAALPNDQRGAIALFYLEDMSVAQVAVALDVPAGTVKTRLMHARRRLRAALEGEE